ncbi:hypothetical protein LCGC14_1288750 [marine sediment metagenome]|uniref:Uncharacterized protein n=1 Tax=marine sediment metagenome TaxID=412755 RepID=A0A0F9N9N5_9ZZZZ
MMKFTLLVFVLFVYAIYCQNTTCVNINCTNGFSCISNLNTSKCLDVCKCSRNEPLSWDNIFGCNETVPIGNIRIEHLIIVIFGVWLPYVSLASSQDVWFGSAISFYVIVSLMIVYFGICLSNSFIGIWSGTILITKTIAFFQVWLLEKPILIWMSKVNDFFTLMPKKRREVDGNTILGKFWSVNSLKGIVVIYFPGLLFLIPIFTQLDKDTTVPWILITGGIMLVVGIAFSFLLDGVEMVCALIINIVSSLLVVSVGIGITVDPEHLGFIISYSIAMFVLFLLILAGFWFMGEGFTVKSITRSAAEIRTTKTITPATETGESTGLVSGRQPTSFLTTT